MTIYSTPFDPDAPHKLPAAASVDSGFESLDEVVSVMGGEYLTRSDGAVIYPGLMFSRYVVSVDAAGVDA